MIEGVILDDSAERDNVDMYHDVTVEKVDGQTAPEGSAGRRQYQRVLY